MSTQAEEAENDGDDGRGVKLSWDEVEEMRERYRSGDATGPELKEEYGVCLETVYDILNENTWKPDSGPGRKLDPDDAAEIRRKYGDGGEVSQSDLAEEFGVTQPVVSLIVNDQIWTGGSE